MRANDIWSLETTREAIERLTTNPGTDSFGVWSPDGKEIAFQSYQRGLAGEIYKSQSLVDLRTASCLLPT
jgi:Tol biopolymer transport system component